MTALDRARAWFLEPGSRTRDDVPRDSPPAAAVRKPPPAAGAAGALGSAAVLGRPGHAEPIAAAVALALARDARARAATVALIAGAAPAVRDLGRATVAASDRVSLAGGAESERAAVAASAERDRIALAAGAERDDPERSTAAGTRAARRLAARLDAHGLPAQPRGRLVWVRVPAEHRQAAARRALLVGAPAVLAVTAPRTADIEELLAEQDALLVVTPDPAGPLARVAALAPGGIPVAVTRPLPRGLARSVALAGVRAPKAVRALLASAALPGTALEAAA